MCDEKRVAYIHFCRFVLQFVSSNCPQNKQTKLWRLNGKINKIPSVLFITLGNIAMDLFLKLGFLKSFFVVVLFGRVVGKFFFKTYPSSRTNVCGEHVGNFF